MDIDLVYDIKKISVNYFRKFIIIMIHALQ